MGGGGHRRQHVKGWRRGLGVREQKSIGGGEGVGHCAAGDSVGGWFPLLLCQCCPAFAVLLEILLVSPLPSS